MKYKTNSGRTWNSTKGWGLNFNNVAIPVTRTGDKYGETYKDWAIVSHDFGNFDSKSVAKALDFATNYIKNGGSASDEKYKKGLEEFIGTGNHEQKIAYIDYLLDKNANITGFDSGGTKYTPIKDEDGNITGYDIDKPDIEDTALVNSGSSSDGGSGLDKYEDLIKNNLMTDAASRQAQQYRDAMYGSIAQYENTANATLASAEMDAYRALGQSQLQLENQIASERMNAIKSGVTSAQLASREIASMFATQTGAAQVASQMAQNRADMANQFGQQRAAVEGDLWNILNGNQQTAANAYAQLGTAQASYASYINSYMAQLQAMNTMRNSIGQNNWENLITSLSATKDLNK